MLQHTLSQVLGDIICKQEEMTNMCNFNACTDRSIYQVQTYAGNTQTTKC